MGGKVKNSIEGKSNVVHYLVYGYMHKKFKVKPFNNDDNIFLNMNNRKNNLN